MLSISGALRNLRESSTHVAFTEAETTQGGEGFGLCFDPTRLGQLSVVAAVSVLEANAPGHTADDAELAAVCCPVVHTAQGDQVVGLVPAALGAEPDVM